MRKWLSDIWAYLFGTSTMEEIIHQLHRAERELLVAQHMREEWVTREAMLASRVTRLTQQIASFSASREITG